MFDPAPTELADVLSPAWLTGALERTYPGVKVAGVRVVETIVTMATKVRFEVDYEAAPEGTPYQFCLKGNFGEGMAAIRAQAAWGAEVKFYREVAPRLSVRRPRVVYAEMATTGTWGMLIMRDEIADGARFLTALNPYTSEQAASSLDQLAQLHAASWNAATLDSYPWLIDGIALWADKPVMTVADLQGYMDGPRGVPLTPELRDASRIEAGLRALRGRTPANQHCLVHGDCHAGNLFENEHGANLIDWQVIQRNGWALDIAYHLAAVLSPEVREASERDLLDYYLDRLRAHGATPPDRETAFTEYRAHMAYGYYLWAITRKVDPPITEEFVRRLGLAVDSLGTWKLLGV